MTRADFYTKDGCFWGFNVLGHTGLAAEGEDILCAAISAMTMLVINTAEGAYSCDIDCVVDEENANIRVTAREAIPDHSSDEKRQFAVSGLIKGLFDQLTDLSEVYSEFLKVTATERSPS